MFNGKIKFQKKLSRTILTAAVFLISVQLADAQAIKPQMESQIEMPSGGSVSIAPMIENGSNNLRNVSGFVWEDANGDGIFDTDESGIAGVTLDLVKNNGQIRDTTTTNVDGRYIFESVPPGSYQVDVTNDRFSLIGYAVTTKNDPASIEVQVKSDATADFGFMPGRFDLGDLPNGSDGKNPAYPTNLGFGAAHILFPDVDNNGKPEGKAGRTATWLGDVVDAEPVGQASPNAKGDDNNGGDEDGVNLSGTWATGSTDAAVDIIVSSSQPATVPVGMWLDWDFDGQFDLFYTVDQVITRSSANMSIPVTIPADFTPGFPVIVRVRAFDPTYSPTSADYAGTFENGEVEDYYIIVGPTAVTMSQLDAGEDFSQSWSVTLIGFLMLALTIMVIRMRKRRLCSHH